MDNAKNTYKNLYFLGIGGIGMSALAQYFHTNNLAVAGYDKTESDNTDLLKAMGVAVSFEDHNDALPGHWKLAETAIVYTPAVPKDLQLIKQFEKLGLPFYKRSEVLGWISSEIPTIAIAGTHGKTTTTAIVTHVLKSAGIPVLAFVGGITSNYGSNIVIDEDPQFLVAEADEFDRSFLKLTPSLSVITSVDADHLDIYGENQQLLEAFKSFAESTQSKVFAHAAVKESLPINAAFYDTEEIGVSAYKIENGKAHIGLKDGVKQVSFSWKMGGKYNACNALAAFCISNQIGISTDKFKTAMETFTGVKRRFETIYEGPNGVLIDDYAHHPTELAALRSALYEMYPDQKITVVFQPHLYSRTKDFMAEFAKELNGFNEVLLLPIFPAREEPIPGVTSEALIKEMQSNHCRMISPIELLHMAASFNGGVFAMVGAGDISKMVSPVKRIMSEN